MDGYAAPGILAYKNGLGSTGGLTGRNRGPLMTANRHDETPTPLRFLTEAAGNEAARQKGQLSGSATVMIRNMIVTGALAPGQRIRERELCETLRVSRTPVREAIKTLLQEGLLRASPNRSPVVTTLDLDEVRSLVVVVATVESLAGRLACAAATDAQIAEIAALQHKMVVHQVHNQMPEYFQTNKTFHRKIVDSACNPVLLSVWDMLALRVDRARYASNLWPERWPEAIKEHQRLLDALIIRDAETLAALMHQHVSNGLSLVVKAMESGGLPSLDAPR